MPHVAKFWGAVFPGADNVQLLGGLTEEALREIRVGEAACETGHVLKHSIKLSTRDVTSVTLHLHEMPSLPICTQWNLTDECAGFLD